VVRFVAFGCRYDTKNSTASGLEAALLPFSQSLSEASDNATESPNNLPHQAIKYSSARELIAGNPAGPYESAASQSATKRRWRIHPGVAVITVLTHLTAGAASTAVTTLTLAAALYSITLAVIAFTAVYGRTAERRHAAHQTLAVLIRHSKSTAVCECELPR
jgi:hypothetical protein